MSSSTSLRAPRTPIPLTEDESAFLQINAWMPRKDLAALFNDTFDRSLTTDNVKGICSRNRWAAANNGKFKKGQKPPSNILYKANKGSFKKGMTAPNRLPVGTLNYDTLGNPKLKIANPSTWVYVHRMVWQLAHGAIPDGHYITFIDGDKTNWHIDNLIDIPITAFRLMSRWGFGDYEGESRATILLTALLYLKALEREKEINGKQRKM